jgi:hypothetical protein
VSRVAHPVAERAVDGGYSGPLTVTRGRGDPEVAPDMVFVESEWLNSRLVLSLTEARALAQALGEVAEVES